jgi:hypothetical protein
MAMGDVEAVSLRILHPEHRRHRRRDQHGGAPHRLRRRDARDLGLIESWKLRVRSSWSARGA